MNPFRPAPYRPRLPEEDARRLYPHLRWQVMEAAFIGYATFYFVRNNLPVVSKEMGEALGYTKGQIGDMLALTAIAYGLGKFFLSAWSDRSTGGLTGEVAAYSTAWMGWRYAFFVPGVLAVLCAFYLIFRLRDTPQSEGLPPVEEYRHDFPPDGPRDREDEIGVRELFVKYILTNRYLWLFAAANFFVHIACYSMLDWGPTYLKEVKRASLAQGGMSTAVFEFAGIFSTILMGWLPDKVGGRRGMVSLLCMVPVFATFGGILYTPPGMLWLDMTLFAVIGFFIYPPVMLLGVTGLDFSSKKGWMAERYGWDAALMSALACSGAAILLLVFTWDLRPLTV